ncbi:MAG: hypothetical protein JWR26_494 [Pedosphaera sp.]|nr:hypothetical protein [Pedosphaera sp.]
MLLVISVPHAGPVIKSLCKLCSPIPILTILYILSKFSPLQALFTVIAQPAEKQYKLTA